MSSNHIPLDIELEIMKRLPVKSLIRFMLACKAWKSSINCSQFISSYKVLPAHLLVEFHKEKTFEPNYVCFVDDGTFPRQKLPLAFPALLQLLDDPRLMGSSCGLFGFYGLLRRKPTPYNIRGMCVLWNPSIRKYVAVVVPNRPLIYDIGFGVCPYTKDPKIVKISYINDDGNPNRTQVMVFTLSSREWRCLCSNQLPRESIKSIRCPKVIGQFIYWYAYDHKSRTNLIMSFDLSTDEFKEVDVPDSLRKSKYSISRLRESLVLLDYNLNPATYKRVCDVWMMMGKAFTKLFTINSPDYALRIAGFRKSGEPIIARRCELPGALVVYEPFSGHIRDFGIYGIGYSHYVYSYMESLLLLDHDDGHVVSLRCGVVKS